jgi:ubiquinone/menaquinone biosynthesis C-methylase UbiE
MREREREREREWNKSYENKDNFVWYPNEEVVRFVATFLKKKIDVDEFKIVRNAKKCLDVGCGIGRHVFFLDDFEFEPYGIDLSTTAIEMAKKICNTLDKKYLFDHFTVGSAAALPYPDGKFDFVVACSVLDSMDFELARKSVEEIARVIQPNGLFCFDLIAEDERFNPSNNPPNKQIIVEEDFEHGTVQSYFDQNKINLLIADHFKLVTNKLISTEIVDANLISRRYFLVAEKL